MKAARHRRIRLGASLLLGTLLLSGVLLAESTPGEALLVLSKRDHTLAIVNPATLKVVARIPVGEDPHEVIASTDGKTAYVSNYGFGAYNTLAVVDLTAQKALPSIDLGALRGPHGLAFVGGKVWFTAEAAKAIGHYDPAAMKVDWIMGTGQNRTHMIFVSADTKRVITTNVSSATVSIIEKTAGGLSAPPGLPGGMRRPMTPPPPQGGMPPPSLPRPMALPGGDWNETVVPVGHGSEGLDVSPDGREIWVANAQDGTISIVDIASKHVTGTVSAEAAGANRLKFTPDGKRVLVSTLGGPDLLILDAASHKAVKRLPVGQGAAGIVMDPNGARAFVACTPDGYVAIVDLQSLTVTGHISAGDAPDGLAWAVRH